MELVKQCHFLELQYSTNFTSASEVLLNSMISLRSLKKWFIEVDCAYCLKHGMDHPFQSLAACITTSIDCLKLWDAALEHGPSGTLASYLIVKLLSKTVFSDRKCSVEQCSAIIPPDCALSEHFNSAYWPKYRPSIVHKTSPPSTKGHISESQGSSDIDWRHKTACWAELFIRPVAGRCIHDFLM